MVKNVKNYANHFKIENQLPNYVKNVRIKIGLNKEKASEQVFGAFIFPKILKAIDETKKMLYNQIGK